ncbi:HipA domain-containing protein [Bradyrhizobium sp. 14AA]
MAAIDAPFTHILKPAGTAGFEALPIVEWICLEFGRAAGFVVPDAALVGMPDGMAPALVVERFDIRRDKADKRRLALEDFCSVLDLPASAKYDGTIERVARGLRPLSTDPADDLDILFRRALFAWLVADGDMHLKNLALLSVAAPGARQFESVRFAPLYDAVTTRVFPGLASDRMALKLNGKDERLTPRDFLTLARTIELSIARAEEAMASVTAATRKAASAISLPAMARDGEGAKSIEERVKAIVAERCGAFA